jgi:hypothetical protein
LRTEKREQKTQVETAPFTVIFTGKGKTRVTLNNRTAEDFEPSQTVFAINTTAEMNPLD